MSLQGKTAVITGASRGIGAEVARMLHERGVNLGLASRSGDDLALDGVVPGPCDVRSLDELASLCDRTAEQFGGIDIVVANAGVGSGDRPRPSSRAKSVATPPAQTLVQVLPGMMTARDVAEVVVFVLERPRHFRILETALRPMTEQSWG